MGTRFYFNTENDRPEFDPDGTELRNEDHARREAIAMMGQMLMNFGGRFRREKGLGDGQA